MCKTSNKIEKLEITKLSSDHHSTLLKCQLWLGFIFFETLPIEPITINISLQFGFFFSLLTQRNNYVNFIVYWIIFLNFFFFFHYLNTEHEYHQPIIREWLEIIPTSWEIFLWILITYGGCSFFTRRSCTIAKCICCFDGRKRKMSSVLNFLMMGLYTLHNCT